MKTNHCLPMFIFDINGAAVLFAQLERIAFDFQRELVRGWRCCYECWSFRQRSVRKRVGSTIRTRSIASSQTAHLMITRTLYCVQGLRDESFCVRRLQSQQEDSDRIEIQTKENFWRKGFGSINFFFWQLFLLWLSTSVSVCLWQWIWWHSFYL